MDETTIKLQQNRDLIKDELEIAENLVLQYENDKEQAHWIVTDALYCVDTKKAINDFIKYMENPNTSKTRNDMISFFERYEWFPDPADTDDEEEERTIKAQEYFI